MQPNIWEDDLWYPHQALVEAQIARDWAAALHDPSTLPAPLAPRPLRTGQRPHTRARTTLLAVLCLLALLVCL